MPRKPWSREEFAAQVPGGAIGMVHLPALPGSPGWQGGMEQVREAALA
jgi:predicted TIM-barrel enzyme